jgi:hypothetical protein
MAGRVSFEGSGSFAERRTKDSSRSALRRFLEWCKEDSPKAAHKSFPKQRITKHQRLFHLTSLFNQTLDEIVPSIQIRTGWFHLILGVFSHPNTSKIILNYGILNFKSTKIRYLKLFVDTDKVKKCQGMPTTCP